jgi:hypothetical protein
MADTVAPGRDAGHAKSAIIRSLRSWLARRYQRREHRNGHVRASNMGGSHMK